jgi:hypothetical protein
LKKTLSDFQSVFEKLQLRDITIAQARKLFDALIVKYSDLGGHIGVDASIMHSPAFERALVKLSNGEALAPEEIVAAQPLLIVEVRISTGVIACTILSISCFKSD